MEETLVTNKLWHKMLDESYNFLNQIICDNKLISEKKLTDFHTFHWNLFLFLFLIAEGSSAH